MPVPRQREATRRFLERRGSQGMDYDEIGEVLRKNAAVWRENREPGAGLAPLPIWLLVIYGFAIFCGGNCLGRYAGTFGGDSLDYGFVPSAEKVTESTGGEGLTAELGAFERGRKIYLANCAPVIKPMARGWPANMHRWPAPNGSWAAQSVFGMVLLKGLEGPITVKGIHYGSAAMQPWEKTLTDAKIADVLTYIRQEWGNDASPVATEGITALRKELAGRSISYRESDLKAVPDDESLPGSETGVGPGGAPGKPPATPAAGPSQN